MILLKREFKMEKMKLIFDFDHTLAYRDGMWTATIYEILHENGYYSITKEDIEPYTQKGFPWYDYEISHKDFFEKLSWWDYMENMIKNIIKNFIVNDEQADKLSKLFRDKYLNVKKWHLFDDTYESLEKAIKK